VFTSLYQEAHGVALSPPAPDAPEWTTYVLGDSHVTLAEILAGAPSAARGDR
jgi:hypothetical protein